MGFAIITDQIKIHDSLPKKTSIFTAESYAILEAVQLATTLPHIDIVVISDSLSCLTALINPTAKHEVIQHIKNVITNSLKNINFL